MILNAVDTSTRKHEQNCGESELLTLMRTANSWMIPIMYLFLDRTYDSYDCLMVSTCLNLQCVVHSPDPKAIVFFREAVSTDADDG